MFYFAFSTSRKIILAKYTKPLTLVTVELDKDSVKIVGTREPKEHDRKL